MEEMTKLLESLQRVNVEFNNQLSKYEALIYHTEQTNEKLDKYTESNREKVDRLCIRVEKRLDELNKYAEDMFTESHQLMEKYTEEAEILNEKERAAFSRMLMEELNRYKEGFLKDVTVLTETAKDTNQEMVSQVYGLRVVINGCLEAINHTIGSINDNYVSVFDRFSKQVSSLNEEERKLFIGELTDALEGYKKDYGLCDELLRDSHKTNQELTRLTMQNAENVKELEAQIDKNLEQIRQLMEYIRKAYQEGFMDFAKDVIRLNDSEKEKFVVTIRSVLEDYRFTFGNEIESKTGEMNALFQNTLLGVCNSFAVRNNEYQKALESTRESNEALQKKMTENLAEVQSLVNGLLFREKTIKDALSFLKEDYKNTIWQYVQELERNNALDREKLFRVTIQNANEGTEKLIRQLDTFKMERSSYLQQMETLLEEERKDRESMLNRQAESINLLKREQESLKKQLLQKQDVLNRYQVITGTVTMVFAGVCMLLLLFLIEPKIFAMVCLLLAVGVGVAITLGRKKIAHWLNKSKKQESTQNPN